MWGGPAASVRLGGSWASTPERPTAHALNIKHGGCGTLTICGFLGKCRCWGFTVWGGADRGTISAGGHQWVTQRALCARYIPSAPWAAGWSKGVPRVWQDTKLRESASLTHPRPALRRRINFNPHLTLWVINTQVFLLLPSSHFTDRPVEDGRCFKTSPKCRQQ